MRCIAVFVGINHASAKLDFANNVQLSLTLAALSLGLWWTFDRSRSGLGLGITVAFLATLITQFLVYNGVYQYTSPDFLYIRSWLPCIFFSGGVTVGNIGRQLAMGVPEKPHSDWFFNPTDSEEWARLGVEICDGGFWQRWSFFLNSLFRLGWLYNDFWKKIFTWSRIVKWRK